MVKFKSTLIAMALGAATLGSGIALADSKEFDGPIPAVMEHLKGVGAGMTVVSNFDAAGGLNGWVIQDGESKEHVVVYTTQDGEVMLAGLAIDRYGNNLSAEYSEKYLPAEDHSAAFEDFTQNADAVLLGSPTAPVELTVAYDANCGFCKVFHKLTEPAIEAGEVRLRVVPVAILGSDSGPKAAGILGAKDADKAVHAATHDQGVIEKSNDTALLAKVQANTQMMRKHGFNGTPLVLYRIGDEATGTIVIANGVPAIRPMFEVLGVDGKLDELAKDPSLARFIR